MWQYIQTPDPDELYHHGILGMKWGVRRYQNPDGSLTVLGKHRIDRLNKKNEKLSYKIENNEIRSAIAEKKSEKIHAKKDLRRSNRAAKKSAKYEKRGAKLREKAIEEDDIYNKFKIESKAAKKQFKSDKYKIKANKLSKLAGYSASAMQYSIKSDKFKAKASKGRMKIANNKKLQALLQTPMSEIYD